MIFNIDSGGGKMSADMIAFDGNFDFAEDGSNWELALYGSGTLRFKGTPGLVDVFVVDGGKPGNDAQNTAGDGGAGGNGGNYKTTTIRLKRGIQYQVSVGGSGESSAISGGNNVIDASDGAHKNGGIGATMTAGSSNVNKAGDDGVYAYGEETDTTIIANLHGVLFAPGGGGHGVTADYVRSSAHGGISTGGMTGGGTGGYSGNGTDGRGYGAGGGGGASVAPDGVRGRGGAGGTGIILIRNRRN
jgi:hypothetical protein